MTYRRIMLLLSVATAALIHAGVYLAAPHIYLLTANSAMPDLQKTFKVDVIELPTPQTDAWRVLDETARPESVRELLRKEDELLFPDTFEREWAEVPDQAERLSESAGERDHSLEFDADKLRTMEARILEIARQDARDELEIPRRVVAPSEDRYLSADDLPTLRGADAEGGGGGRFFSAYESTLSGEGTGGGSGSGGGSLDDERGDFSERALDDPSSRPDLPALGAEDLVAREGIKSAIREANDFEVLDEMVDINVETYVDRATGEGFFKLQIFPQEDASIPTIRKDITFVLDASKSIGQRKLDGAAQGVAAALRLLMPQDRFNVVIFRDNPSYFRSELVPATPENQLAAAEFLKNLESIGATNVYGAMRSVVMQPPSHGISDFIVLVSDGRPTGGSLEGRDLINALTADNTNRRTIYTVGAGTSANQYLLDLLAYRNKGVSYISPRSDTLDDDIPRFFERVREPVLVDLKADYGRIPRDEVFPREIPDFYRGRVVTVYGKFDPARDRQVVMRLRGRAGAQEKELVFKTDLSASDSGNPSIAQDWAFQKSYYLIGEICAVGEVPGLVDELDRLSRTYGVKTSYSP